jgi:hypothetical protein
MLVATCSAVFVGITSHSSSGREPMHMPAKKLRTPGGGSVTFGRLLSLSRCLLDGVELQRSFERSLELPVWRFNSNPANGDSPRNILTDSFGGGIRCGRTRRIATQVLQLISKALLRGLVAKRLPRASSGAGGEP